MTEHNKVRNALIDWIASQNPRPGDVTVAMAQTIAGIIAQSAHSRDDLENGLDRVCDVIRMIGRRVYESAHD